MAMTAGAQRVPQMTCHGLMCETTRSPLSAALMVTPAGLVPRPRWEVLYFAFRIAAAV